MYPILHAILSKVCYKMSLPKTSHRAPRLKFYHLDFSMSTLNLLLFSDVCRFFFFQAALIWGFLSIIQEEVGPAQNQKRCPKTGQIYAGKRNLSSAVVVVVGQGCGARRFRNRSENLDRRSVKRLPVAEDNSAFLSVKKMDFPASDTAF